MIKETISKIIDAIGNNKTLDYAREYVAKNQHKKNINNTPYFHMTAPIGWLNDPNGFIYYKGQYHLFYQYNPLNTHWGLMYWGHAISNDLITWEHLPVAMAPDTEADNNGVFSGSAIEKDGKLYVMYTGNKHREQVQNIAYLKNDIDFAKYEGNPVISKEQLPQGGCKKDFRDPKIWYQDGKYHAVIGSMVNGKPVVLRFSSDDIHNWKYHSTTFTFNDKALRECPDYFSLGDKKVLIVSNVSNSGFCEWIVGREEDNVLVLENYDLLDEGNVFYAPQTLEVNGRRIMTAWMRWKKDVPSRKNGYASTMSIPRELSIKDGRLWVEPVKELEKYRFNEVCYKALVIDEKIEFNDLLGDSIDMVIDVKIDKEEALNIIISKSTVEYIDIEVCKDSINLTSCTLNDKGKKRENTGVIKDNELNKSIRIIIDKYSYEIFVNGRCMSFNLLTQNKDTKIALVGKNKPIIDILKYDLKKEI